MLLYLNVLVLLLLQPALSSPKPLTTPSRGCPTCRGKPTQSQPPVDLNATTLAVGEPCGVYTLSCAHGLRCAPPEDDPRPLRTLLEGRGVCSNTSSISPTEKSLAVGKGPTLCLEEDGNERAECWVQPSVYCIGEVHNDWSFNTKTHHLLIYLSVFDNLSFHIESINQSIFL